MSTFDSFSKVDPALAMAADAKADSGASDFGASPIDGIQFPAPFVWSGAGGGAGDAQSVAALNARAEAEDLAAQRLRERKQRKKELAHQMAEAERARNAAILHSNLKQAMISTPMFGVRMFVCSSLLFFSLRPSLTD